MLGEDLHSGSWLVVRGTWSSSLPKPFDFLRSEKILKKQTKHHLYQKKIKSQDSKGQKFLLQIQKQFCADAFIALIFI